MKEFIFIHKTEDERKLIWQILGASSSREIIGTYDQKYVYAALSEQEYQYFSYLINFYLQDFRYNVEKLKSRQAQQMENISMAIGELQYQKEFLKTIHPANYVRLQRVQVRWPTG